MTIDAHPDCFLCAPDQGLVYEREADFFAMLGHGPLGVGYSLIAAVEHYPSMLDLDSSAAAELDAFTVRVRDALEAYWPGGCCVTEHGRVAVCVAAAVGRYEPHCLHAHRLVFPGVPELDLRALGVDPQEHASFGDAHRAARLSLNGPYLYAERADGSCQLAAANARVPRQALRRLVAAVRGESEFADWSRHPRLDLVREAQHALGLIDAA